MEQSDTQEKNVEALILFVKHRRVDFFFLGLGVLLGIFLEWDIVEVAIFGVFIWSILGPISSQLLAVPALLFLAVVPFLLLFKMDDQAEIYAVYAYYFLVMAVIRGIIEVRREEKD